MTQISPSSGFPVLAYPEYDTAVPISLSLVFKYNESRAQATLCLLSSLFIRACEDAQTFILQYDADNIVPGKISLGPATIPFPQARLKALAREGNPQMRTLSLTLKKVCPVWCLLPSRPFAPRPAYEAPFHQLAKLAQALKLYVVFDYNWLHRDHHTSFQRLIKHPEELSGFPVGQHYRQQQYKCLDWSVFNTGDADAHADADATTEDEEPPPMYTKESSKRPRDVSTSPTPSSPPLKQVILSPCPGGIYASPTDNDSAPTPSPKLPYSSATPSPKFPLSAALSPKPLSLAAPSPQPPYSPAVPTSDLQRAVEEAVSTLLPRLLAASSPTPFSQQSIASQISHAPPPLKLSALGISLHNCLDSRIKSEIGRIYTQTLSHANYLRKTADAEFEEYLEELRLQFGTEGQDVMSELQKVADEKLQAFQEECENLVEYAKERAGQKADYVVDHTKERLDELEHTEVSLKREKEELRREKEELRREKKKLRREEKELRREKKELRREKKELRRDKQESRNHKQDVRRERRGLRMEREILRRDQREFESKKRRAAEGNGCIDQGNRSRSAPV